MNEWNFNKNDLEKIIKTGEILLNQKLPKKAKEEVLNEINTLKNFINGNYNEYEREYVDNRLFFIKKNKYLKEMEIIYKKLDKNIINWLIRLEQQKIFFDMFDAPQITLSINMQKEYTLKNYEKHSKIQLPLAEQIFSPYPINQIQVCKELEESSFSRYFKIADLPLIIINPNDGAATLNHEVEHAIESALSYDPNYFYHELGPIFYEILFNELIYYDKNILPIERLEDFSIGLETISEYFQLMLKFSNYDFKVPNQDFKDICIKTLDLIPEEIEEWLNDELEFDYEGEIKYIFSHLKAIELVKLVNKNQDCLNLIEPYLNTDKFYFEPYIKKFKIYETYINDVKEKILKR